MPASVFIEHGTIAIAEQPWLPLAIVAPRSRLLSSVNEPALTAAVFRRQVRHQPLDRRVVSELVAQQAAPVVGYDQLDVKTARSRSASVRTA